MAADVTARSFGGRKGVAALLLSSVSDNPLTAYASIWVNVVLAAVILVALLGVGILFVEGRFDIALTFVALATLYGLSIAMLGVFVGFLFGVPRVIAAVSENNAAAAGGLQTNTNIERISDWLSAAIVALSLTQIGQVREKVNEIAAAARNVFACPAEALAATGAACPATFATAAAVAPIAAVAMTTIGAVAGMLIGYVSTRVFLTRLFKSVQDEINEVEDAVDEVGSPLSAAVERLSTANASGAEVAADTKLTELANNPMVDVLANAPKSSIRDGRTAKAVTDAKIAKADWLGAAITIGIAIGAALLKQKEIDARTKLIGAQTTPPPAAPPPIPPETNDGKEPPKT